MVNIYNLRNALKNMGIYSLTQLKEQGVWYPLKKYNKPDTNIWVYGGLYGELCYILSIKSNFQGEELEKWKNLLAKNQWDLYPLLLDLSPYFMKDCGLSECPTEFDFYYHYSKKEGTLSVIIKFED